MCWARATFARSTDPCIQSSVEAMRDARLGPNAFLCTPRKATDPTRPGVRLCAHFTRPDRGGKSCRMMLTPSTVCSDEEEAGLPWSCLETIERRAHDTVVSLCCVLLP